MKKIIALLLTLVMMVLPMVSMAEEAVVTDAQTLVNNLMNVVNSGKKITETYAFEVPERNAETENPMVSIIMDLLGVLGSESSVKNGQVKDSLTLQGQTAVDLTIAATGNGVLVTSNLLGGKVIGMDGEDVMKLIQSSGKLPINEDGSLNLEFTANLDMANLQSVLGEVMSSGVSMLQIESWTDDSDPAVGALQIDLDGERIAALVKALVKDLQPLKETLEQMNAASFLELTDEQIEESTKTLHITLTVYLSETQEPVAVQLDVNDTNETKPVSAIVTVRRYTEEDARTWHAEIHITQNGKEEVGTVVLSYAYDGGTVSLTVTSYEPDGDDYKATNSVSFNYAGIVSGTSLNGTISAAMSALNEETGALAPNGAIIYDYELNCDGQTCEGSTRIQLKAALDTDPIVIANGTITTGEPDPSIAESQDVTYIMKLSDEERQEFATSLLTGVMPQLASLIGLLPESVQQLVGGMMQ